jgi:glycosyltransferase
MKISVITISRNSVSSIGDTIRSVISQTHPDLEYIIVDGQSVDGTAEVIRSFGSAITRWISEPDDGLYDALNKGLALATGEVVGFLHSDDVFEDERVIETVAVSFSEATTQEAVYGDIRYVDQSDPRKILTNRKSGKFRRWKFLFGWSPPHPTFYMKRDLYLKHGGFDTTFDIAGDYEVMLRYLVRNRISAVYVPEIRVRMRVGGVCNRTMKNIRKKWKEDHRAMKKNHFGNLVTLFFKTMRPIAHFSKSPRYLFE